jgi:hypothetical protein
MLSTPEVEEERVIKHSEKTDGRCVSEDEIKSEESLLSRIKKRKEKKKIEDTHTRQTFLIKNELTDQLAKLYKKYGYGFKTEFINDAIEKRILSFIDEEKMAK